MSPISQSDGPSRVDRDLQDHAKTLTELTLKIGELQKVTAVMVAENKYRDEKISSILGLGRTVLITIVTLAIGAGFAFLAGGGLRV